MQNNNNETKSNSIRVKDLSIYSDNGLSSINSSQKNAIYVTFNKEKNDFEKFITSTREFIFDYIDKFSEQKERAKQFYETGVAHSRTTLDYIRSESNILPKITFITLSGLAGVVFGYKRSKFRKFTYSTLFIAASTAICYPNEAKKYSCEAYEWSKKTSKQVYNDYIMPQSPKSSNASPATTTTTTKESKFVSTNEKDKILTLKHSDEPVKKVIGDKGQSSDDDKDMYTTRSK